MPWPKVACRSRRCRWTSPSTLRWGPGRPGWPAPRGREHGPPRRGSRLSRPPRFPLALDRLDSGRAAPERTLRPQRPLQQAARDALHRASPRAQAQGLGLDSEAVRGRMVARLRAEGLRCEPVLQALAQVERHRFVDTALATQAYEDTSLPIGHGQTISKPSVVGRMLALLFEGGHAREHGHLGRALEIGTGCGYQAALLLRLAKSVVSVERLKALHEKAREHLAAQRGADLRLVWGDGRLGHAPRAPFHSIVAAAGGDALPEAWLTQLAPGGRLVAPLHDEARGGQVLLVVDHRPEGLVRQWHDAVHFVPLKSGAQ
ncbi:MAG: protein-L-isoaspartate O-methyltransferase [Burkholderiales bacterium]|nr:protein-L-isoaspartate O-methyltransferase [Burkholderiales bacterium]